MNYLISRAPMAFLAAITLATITLHIPLIALSFYTTSVTESIHISDNYTVTYLNPH